MDSGSTLNSIAHAARRAMMSRGWVVLLVVALLAIAGCDTSGGGALAPTFTPRPTETSVSVPTVGQQPTDTEVQAEPTDTEVQAEPTDTEGTSQDNTPTTQSGESTPTEGGSIGDLTPYTSKTGNWSISYPTGWTTKQVPVPNSQNGVNTQFARPDQRALVQVTYIPGGRRLSQQEVVNVASQDLSNTFKSFNYKETGRAPQNDGSTRIDFTLTPAGQNYTGEAFVEQRGFDYYMLMIAYDEQLADTEFNSTLRKEIIDSYTLPADTGGGGATATQGGGSGSAPTATEGTLSTPSGGGGGTGSGPLLPVGSTGQVGGVKVTLNSVHDAAGSSVLPPAAGKKYIILNVTLQNGGTSDLIASSILSFAVYDSAGNKMDETYGAGQKQIESQTATGATSAGTVPPNGSLTGEVAYEVPTNAQGLIFVYTLLDALGSPAGTVRFSLGK